VHTALERAQESGIVLKATLLAHLCHSHPRQQFFPGGRDSLLRDVPVNRVAGLDLKLAHHMVFAHIQLRRQTVHGYIFKQMLSNILQHLHDLLVVHGSGPQSPSLPFLHTHPIHR